MKANLLMIVTEEPKPKTLLLDVNKVVYVHLQPDLNNAYLIVTNNGTIPVDKSSMLDIISIMGY